MASGVASNPDLPLITGGIAFFAALGRENSDLLDLLISNATIVDGTGSEPYPGHVGIKGDTICGLWRGDAPSALQVLNAAGKMLTPGFIDVHSHADLIHAMPSAQRRDLLLGRLAQGITTELIGNCGLGASPSYGEAAEILPLLDSWMSPEGCRWNWDSTASYLEVLESTRLDCNVGALLPHGPLRVSAMGLAPGAPDARQAALMTKWAEEALDAGVFGLSTGLIYAPGMFSSTEEIKTLARLVGRRGRTYASHIRGSSETLLESVEELLDIGRDTGIAVHHSHCEAVGRDHWWKLEHVLEREQKAASEGVAVSFDMFPYTAAATMMLALYPPWSLEGGVNTFLERLRDPTMRQRIREDIVELKPEWPPWEAGRWPHNLVTAVGWDNIYISSCSELRNKEFEFLSIRDLAEKTGKSPFDAVSDLMIDESGKVSMLVFEVSGSGEDESNLEHLLKHPLGICATDANDYGKGHPHPAAYGAFPRILSHFVRDKEVCSLADAVRKMTNRPAELFGIDRRGIIREGYFADLVLLDYEHLTDRATFRSPRCRAQGIELVFVNGRITFTHDGRVSEGAGRLLRRR